MDRIAYFHQKALQCRQLARNTRDSGAALILVSTAESYEAQARTLQRERDLCDQDLHDVVAPARSGWNDGLRVSVG